MDDQAQIATFVSMTGQDAEFAENWLAARGYELDRAVNEFFAFESGGGSGGGNSNTGGRKRKQVDSYERERLRAPVKRFRDTLIPAAPSYEAPGRATSSDPFRNVHSERKVRAPKRKDWTQASKSLADLFAPPTGLLFDGTFEQARAAALQQNKWLLVNILNSKEFASHMLNRDTWKAEALLPFLLENFVFWQSDFEQPRALNYCRLYRLPLGSPPHIGLVDPRTKQSMKTWTGFVAPEQMLEDLSAFIAENPMTRFETLDPVATASSSSALPDDVISATMTDDERLAKAIQESLAASAPVAAEDAKHASSTEESSDNAATSDEEEESQVVEEEAKTGETVSVEVPAEPEAGPDVVNIQIVFQNGNKVRRRVHTTLLLSELYELTLLLAQAQGCAEGSTIEAFDLVCSWPKRVLPRVKDRTVQDENLKNSALRVLWL